MRRRSPERLALDRAGPSAGSAFLRARKAEANYARQLRKVARHIGDIVMGLFDEANPSSASVVERALRRYSQAIEPWAEAVGNRMIADVAARDRKAWMEVSREMGGAIRRQIAETPTGLVMQQALSAQIGLITSLPTEAAERVQGLAQEAIVLGGRDKGISAEIMRSGDVSKARAETIARTEVSRAQVELSKATAMHLGSTHFIWRTTGDSRVRESHRRLSGQSFRWDDPPECDPGHKALPGGIWNCRCWAHPIIPDDY